MAANDPIDDQRLSGMSDDNAEEAVAHWLPFVKRLARQTYKFAPRGELLDDLEGDGFEALVRALDSFDPTRGVPPEGWIALKVRGAMIDGLRRRYPGRYRRRRQQHERLGSVEFVSLDTPVGGADAGLTLEETLADVAAIPVEEQVEEREHLAARRNRLRAALEKLSKREKRVLVLRHVKEMSFAEVAACEGVTESRIQKIEQAARVKAGEDPAAASSSGPCHLSEIELKVLQSTAAGDTTLDTAKRLRRSIETVKTHRSAVIRKLGARNMYHALSKAYEVGILQ